MKQPRITDFDPNADPADRATAEQASLPELGSPLDDLPRIQPRVPDAAAAAGGTSISGPAPDSATRSSHHPVPPVSPVPPVLPVPPGPLEPGVPLGRTVRDVPPKRRPIKQRHPFDIYFDQLDTLRQLALDERKQGGVGSMSAMVREALDEFLAKKKHG